jgi:hypothetical protein
VVPDSFEGLEGVIRSTYERLVAEGVLTPTPDVEVPEIPVDLATAVKQGKVRGQGGGGKRGRQRGMWRVEPGSAQGERDAAENEGPHTWWRVQILGARQGRSQCRERGEVERVGRMVVNIAAGGRGAMIDSGRRGGRQAQWFILLA